MIELLLLNVSHDAGDLAAKLKRSLGRQHSSTHKSLFRIRCHNMIEAEELAHRLPQVIGGGISIGIADWENAELTGGDDVRNAFTEAIGAPQPVEDVSQAGLVAGDVDQGVPANDDAEPGEPTADPDFELIDALLSKGDALEPPAAKPKGDRKRRKVADVSPADSTIQ